MGLLTPTSRSWNLGRRAGRSLASLVAVMAVAPTLKSAPGPRAAPVPAPGPAPLLYVRLTGTPGMQVTFYPGGPTGKTLAMPATVGLRPGYIYQLRISGLAGQAHKIIYPTLEVRGSLLVPPRFRAADYPAP